MGREDSRWTYVRGSRPEGVIVYDSDTKLHSHHDTDPARGQHSAWDLVRLHRFGHLDAGAEEAPITARPSHIAMVEWASQLPEIRAERVQSELQDLGEPVEEKPHEPADQRQRFAVYSAGEFSSGPPVDWIVRGLLPRAEVAVIYGESGSGKSFLTLDVCAAIARGVEWRGKRVAQGRVVYVCAEGAGGFKSRLQAYARGHTVGMDELPAVIPDAPNLLDPAEAAALIKAIVDWGKVDVVVIDTLSATTPGGNENSGEDMGLVLSHCKFLHRKTGALVVLIHHSGKDATRGARGWSGLRAAADAEIEVTRNGDYRNAAITKLKDGADGESMSFKLKVVPLGTDDEGNEVSSCIIEHVEGTPSQGVAKQKPGGRHEVVVLDVLKVMAPSGSVNLEDLRNGYLAKMPADGEPDKNRKRDFKRALENLVAKKLAYMHAGDRVSLSTLVITGSDEWLN